MDRAWQCGGLLLGTKVRHPAGRQSPTTLDPRGPLQLTTGVTGGKSVHLPETQFPCAQNAGGDGKLRRLPWPLNTIKQREHQGPRGDSYLPGAHRWAAVRLELHSRE